MKTISIAEPYVPKEAIREVVKTLKTRWIGQAHKVDEFEVVMEKKFGDHAVAVNSGTSALELAYDLIGLKKGDEVITTVFTCTATNIPLVRRGCKLVFADIDKDTLCISDDSIAKKITPKTKAIVIVNLGGMKANISDYGIPVVADSCQALGTQNGDYTAYSFQAIKHITTGDGGMLMCKDPEQAKKAKLWRWFGIDRKIKIENNWEPYKDRKILFDIDYPGYKFQMNDIAASMGIAAMKKYDKIMEHREKIFNIYSKNLFPLLVDGMWNKKWLATLIVKDRDYFSYYLRQRGIETNVMQLRNDLYSIFKPFRRKLKNMDAIEHQYICIPLHNKMTLKDARYICSVIDEIRDKI